jgi:signal transduction histidine kinase
MNRRSGSASIRERLANTLLLWSVVWSAGVALAVALAARHEVDELLDDALRAEARLLGPALAASGPVLWPAVIAGSEGDFAWQLLDAQGQVLRRSANAPAQALESSPHAGFDRSKDWRLYGQALGSDGRLLVVAHKNAERVEAGNEVVMSAVLSALAIGLLGHLWLRFAVRRELRPLERLSAALEAHDPLLQRGHSLGPAERSELEPVHRAIDGLGARLAQRLAHERAFSAHAAHALRTPLAGMDAQLAVALRESAPGSESHARLARVREASTRLQRVVRALLDLFRAGGDVRRQPVDLPALVATLGAEGLSVEVEAGAPLDADPDLLAAALSNLLDNARRHGARQVRVSLPAPGAVRVADDGPGVGAERAQALRRALAAQDYEERMGLGLMLADLVARAHGGALLLPETTHGFAAELHLTPIGEGTALAG